MQIPLMKRWLSYLFPVRVKTTSGSENPVLELFLYRNQWQLGTEDALYSDGNRYRPLAAAYDELPDVLPQVKDVLVLGGGLGSALYQLKKRGLYPNAVLVEKDEVVLKLALELLPPDLGNKLLPICADARAFMAANEKSFDLIIIDVFEGRRVPEFVMGTEFLQQCAQKIRTNGALVLNYMILDEAAWQRDLATFTSVFSRHKVIDLGLNRVLVVRA